MAWERIQSHLGPQGAAVAHAQGRQGSLVRLQMQARLDTLERPDKLATAGLASCNRVMHASILWTWYPNATRFTAVQLHLLQQTGSRCVRGSVSSLRSANEWASKAIQTRRPQCWSCWTWLKTGAVDVTVGAALSFSDRFERKSHIDARPLKFRFPASVVT